jgi:phosphoribosylaminoimidazole-succinocarboxamide synthase
MARIKLYEGKAKIIYDGPQPGTLIQHFKDDVTAGNGARHEIMTGKGVLNNRISEYLMEALEECGVYTHFIKSLNMREQLVRACDIIPLEVIVRNITAGSFSKRFGVEDGLILPRPIVEFCLKSDKIGDPLISEDHIVSVNICDDEELDEIKDTALRINDILSGIFYAVGLKLVDFKVEFGKVFDEAGNEYIILADEISPDSCRLWDIETGDSLDKDRFRKDKGGMVEAYQEVATRLGVFGQEVKESKTESVSQDEVKLGRKNVVQFDMGFKKPKKD